MAENNQANAPAQEQDLSEILKVRREKLAALRAEGRDPFQQTRFDVSHHAQDIKDHFDELEGTEVTVGGRLMSKRGMGKVSFCDLQDKSGRIQIYARKDEMDEEEYNRFKKYDIGDIVGVRGEVFRTQRGEMSVRAKEITLLSKSLRPLPEKFHGLQDKELRYRQRYVDLIVNPESKRNFEIRSKFVAFLRRYLDDLGFMEVETPVLSPIAGGANARPFITHHNTLDIDMYMRIATELHLKRLIVGGLVGALIGFLKYRFNINEVVSSIMLNYTFQYVISFFINTFFVDPVSRQSKEISAASRLTLMDTVVGNLKMDIPLGIILALLTVVGVWFLLEKTKLGYELKAVGYSRSAAKYAGIKVGRSMVLSMTISGALAGLAGVTYYLGYVGSIQPKVLISTGFDAIAVSLLGNNNPFGIVFSTMLITLISKGSTYMKSAAGVDAEIASVITGIILLFSACNAYIKWKMERSRREKNVKTKEDK